MRSLKKPTALQLPAVFRTFAVSLLLIAFVAATLYFLINSPA